MIRRTSPLLSRSGEPIIERAGSEALSLQGVRGDPHKTNSCTSEADVPVLGGAGHRSGGSNHRRVGESGSCHPLAVRERDPYGVIEVMSSTLRSVLIPHRAFLGVVFGLALLSRVLAGASVPESVIDARRIETAFGDSFDPAAVQTQLAAAPPRFVYGSGAQGFGYYTAQAPQPAPAATAPRPAAPARSSVGPGARNWSTGRRSPLHRPWMRPM
jgi:hypothetical protein